MSHAPAQFWRPRELATDRTCLWRLGALRLWIRRDELAWRLAEEYGETFDQMNASVVPHDVVPERLEWHTIALERTHPHFFLRPELPDLPVVARPDEPVVVPAGEHMTYYCLLPAWARFCLYKEDQTTLQAFEAWPTRRLSRTWFGDPANGLLGYALAFPFVRDWQALAILPQHVIVPVRIENASGEHLSFERLCLRPQHMGIYAGSRDLWASAVEVVFHGVNRASSLHYGTTCPREASGARLVSAARERAERSLAGITFSAPSPNDFRSRPA
ncbi:MAG: hypothetical protein ACLFR7_04500 [Opitutales bacterium]